MPGYIKKIPISKIKTVSDEILALSDEQLSLVGYYTVIAGRETRSINNLNFGQFHGMLQAFFYLDYNKDVSKTTLYRLLNIDGKGYKEELPEVLAIYFDKSEKRRYTLNAKGFALRAQWAQSLRRTISDVKEYYRLFVCRYDKSEIAKRDLHKRFYKQDESEQIRILRDYWSLPYQTEEQRRQRNKAARILARDYDLKQWEVIKAVEKFGLLVKSVRLTPEIAPLFLKRGK